MFPENLSSPEGKNSPLRLHTAKYMKKAAGAFYEKFPKVKPNHVSIFGAVSVLGGGVLIEKQNRRPHRSKIVISVGAGLQAIGYFCDALDGALDRKMNEITPGITEGSNGSLVDLIMDKTGEVGLASMRSKTAKHNGSRIGVWAADAVSVTTIVPSEIREGRNEKGIVIDEVGNPITFLGSRPGRVIFTSISSLAPKFQPVSDGLGAVANIYASYHRWNVSDQREGAGFTAKEIAIARKRKQAMHVMEALSVSRLVFQQLRKPK